MLSHKGRDEGPFLLSVGSGNFSISAQMLYIIALPHYNRMSVKQASFIGISFQFEQRRDHMTTRYLIYLDYEGTQKFELARWNTGAGVGEALDDFQVSGGGFYCKTKSEKNADLTKQSVSRSVYYTPHQ